MKGDCHSSGQGDLRTSGTLSIGNLHCPSLHARPSGCRAQDDVGRLEQGRSRLTVTHFGYATDPVDFSRLVPSRCEAEIRTDRPGSAEAFGIIDRCPVGERGDGSYARHGHEATADGIHSKRSQDEPVQIRQVLAQTPVHLQDRFKNTQQQPIRSDQLSNPCLETNARDGANL